VEPPAPPGCLTWPGRKNPDDDRTKTSRRVPDTYTVTRKETSGGGGGGGTPPPLLFPPKNHREKKYQKKKEKKKKNNDKPARDQRREKAGGGGGGGGGGNALTFHFPHNNQSAEDSYIRRGKTGTGPASRK